MNNPILCHTYHTLAKLIISELHKIHRYTTRFEYNYNHNRKAIKLIKSYHDNVGQDFLVNPFHYLNIDGFGENK